MLNDSTRKDGTRPPVGRTSVFRVTLEKSWAGGLKRVKCTDTTLVLLSIHLLALRAVKAS
jgi:hypothetical protein